MNKHPEISKNAFFVSLFVENAKQISTELSMATSRGEQIKQAY